jgi:AAA+ superfamily predicted ATPase
MAIEDLLNRGSESAEALALKAHLLLDEGDAAGATAAYRRAIEFDPGLADLGFATRLGEDLPGPPTDRASDPPSSGPGSDGGVAAPAGDSGASSVGGPRDGDPADRERVRIGGEKDDKGEHPVDVERPKIGFADVGGMEAIKEDIRLKIIAPVEHAELYAAYGKTAGGGILLFGPPGCGKTHLARATAGEMGRGFISVGISDVLDMWLGQSERNLRDIFDGARSHQPCVLFFDEVDALAASRTDLRHSAGRNVVNQFLSELDGIDTSNEGVLVLAATNAPWHLDPAFRRPGRFDRVIFVPPPDAPARSAILAIQLRGKPAADVDVDQVASRLDMFSGADIKGLVDQAVEAKLGEAMRTGIPTPLRTKDLLDVAKTMVPTTREWFATARNHVLYANQAGLYDAVRPWLKL